MPVRFTSPIAVRTVAVHLMSVARGRASGDHPSIELLKVLGI